MRHLKQVVVDPAINFQLSRHKRRTEAVFHQEDALQVPERIPLRSFHVVRRDRRTEAEDHRVAGTARTLPRALTCGEVVVGMAIVIAGTREDWPGGPRTLTPREPTREPNGTLWFGAELDPDGDQVWFRIAPAAVARMPAATPADRGRLLVDALIFWGAPPPRHLARRPAARGRHPGRVPRRTPRPGPGAGERGDDGGRGMLPARLASEPSPAGERTAPGPRRLPADGRQSRTGASAARSGAADLAAVRATRRAGAAAAASQGGRPQASCAGCGGAR